MAEYTQEQIIQAGKDLVDLLLTVAKSNNNLTGFIKEYLIELTSNNGIYRQQQEEMMAFAASSDTVHRQIFDNTNLSAQKLSEICSEFASMNTEIERVHAGGQETTAEVVKLAENIIEIRKFIKDIQDISSKTNLLSFNASIEAAHAGEAGKGFSVVADEIRKLAETSAEQSNNISEELTNIQQGIERVVIASSESEQSFQAVSQRINLTADLIAQIRCAMEEQQAGSQQILEALQAMNDSTTEVRGAGAEMSRGGDAIIHDVSSIQDSMNNIEKAVSEINAGTNFVNESTKELRNISAQLNVAIKRIKDDVDLFKV